MPESPQQNPHEHVSLFTHVRRSFHGLGHRIGLWKPLDDRAAAEKAVTAKLEQESGAAKPAAKKARKLTMAEKLKAVTALPGSEVASATPGKKGSPKAEAAALHAKEEKELLEAKKVYEEGLASLKDLIAPSSMKIDYDAIQVDNVYAQTYMVYAYPRFLDTNWLSPVINFDATIDISMFIYPIDSGKIMKALKTKVGQFSSSISIDEEKGKVRDPGLQHALEDAEELRDKIQQGIEKFFQFALYFTVYSEEKEKLPHLGKQLESYLGGKLILTKAVKARTEQAFNSCAPYATDELYVVRNMNTEPLSTSFPFTSNELTDDKGILYGLNRINNSLIIFDRFSLPNANSVVFATSGAGKSFAVKLEILRSLMFGTDVICIDPEREYEPLVETVGGSYIDVSLNSDKRINPFDLPLPLKDVDEKPGDLLRQAIITLHGLMALMLGKLKPEEIAILDQALVDTYALKGITMETVNPGDITPPTMEDLYDVLVDTKGGEEIARRLKQYTSGIFSGVFNKQTNIDLSSGLVAFSIRDLDEILRPTAIYVILNYIWNRVRSSLKRRILVIDEAWELMQHEDSAKFLFGLVKRARKYYLGVTVISQNVEDFVNSDLGKPIITNSAMQLLLKQAPSALDKLQEIFDLTEQERYFLLQASVGEGLFFADRKHVAIQVIASPQEERIITTNPEDLLKQAAEKANFDAS